MCNQKSKKNFCDSIMTKCMFKKLLFESYFFHYIYWSNECFTNDEPSNLLHVEEVVGQQDCMLLLIPGHHL